MRTRLDIELAKQVTAVLADEIDRRCQIVGLGNATDFAHYRQQCGEIIGMKAALAVIEDLTQKLAEA